MAGYTVGCDKVKFIHLWGLKSEFRQMEVGKNKQTETRPGK